MEENHKTKTSSLKRKRAEEDDNSTAFCISMSATYKSRECLTHSDPVTMTMILQKEKKRPQGPDTIPSPAVVEVKPTRRTRKKIEKASEEEENGELDST